MNKKEAEELLNKYLDGKCTIEEKHLVEKSYNVAEQELPELDFEPDYSYWHRAIKNQLPGALRRVRLWPRAVAAVFIFACVAFGFYFYQKDHNTPTEITTKNDIAPGGNKAFLTLADGKRIALTDLKNGELAQQSGVKITKAADGQLVYTVSDLPNENNKINTYNTIETPRGGTYQVRLPDGTKVWLNAASTLKYPVSFTSSQARRVTLLSGEAYFEVAKDRKHPFIVKTDQQEVEVLGTHFNINNYEPEVRTTLIEGSVRVRSKLKTKVLKPNQSSMLVKNDFDISEANIEETMAWKNGYFKFNNESIQRVMQKITRWYDVEVQYQPGVSSEGYNGAISRYNNISQILQMLEATGAVHFKIKERRIIVMP